MWIMTASPACSRTGMNFSDSIVQLAKVIASVLMLSAGICQHKREGERERKREKRERREKREERKRERVGRGTRESREGNERAQDGGEKGGEKGGKNSQEPKNLILQPKKAKLQF